MVIVGELGGGPPPGIEQVEPLVELRFVRSAAELVRALPGAEVVFQWDFGSTWLRDAFGQADSLRWIHVAGAGVDAVMSPELAAGDVVLTNARGVFDRSIAETVAGWMLVFAKDMVRSFANQTEQVWQHRETEMLRGRSALVIGMGGIGREIARMLMALGLEVTGMARSERPDPNLGLVRSIDDLDELVSEADFVILVLPSTTETGGLFGEDQFRRMKRTARLINIGRGDLVDEEALVAALDSGEISGAALDVFAEEPLRPGHPLWSMPQVIVSPHMSADFHGWLDALADQFIANLKRWLAGEPLADQVDKRRGYVPGSEAAGGPDA